MTELPIRVFIVDDHPLLRVGAATYLSNSDRFNVLGDTDNADDGLEMVRTLLPDVVTLDIRLTGEHNGVWHARFARTGYRSRSLY